MNSKILENNIAELEAQINALKFKNSELEVNVVKLKTNNQTLSKKAEWLETELAMSKHHCALLKNAIYGKRSEKAKTAHTEQMSLLFNEAEAYANDEEDTSETTQKNS